MPRELSANNTPSSFSSSFLSNPSPSTRRSRISSRPGLYMNSAEEEALDKIVKEV